MRKFVLTIIAMLGLSGCIAVGPSHSDLNTQIHAEQSYDLLASFFGGMSIERPEATVRLAVILGEPFSCVVQDAHERTFVLSGLVTMTAERKFSLSGVRIGYTTPQASVESIGVRRDLGIGQPYTGGGIGGPSFRIVVVKSGEADPANKSLERTRAGDGAWLNRKPWAARAAQFHR